MEKLLGDKILLVGRGRVPLVKPVVTSEDLAQSRDYLTLPSAYSSWTLLLGLLKVFCPCRHLNGSALWLVARGCCTRGTHAAKNGVHHW